MTTTLKNRRIPVVVVTSGFFTFIFLYFLLFNRYHLLYLEQEQLFRYNPGYISGLLQHPGGFMELVSAFLVQFFFHPWLAAAIITGVLSGIFLLFREIMIYYKLNVILLPFIPVLLLAALLSNHNAGFAFITGSAFILLLFRGYLSLHTEILKYVGGIFGFVISYFLAGGFSIVLIAWIIIHELLNGGKMSFRFRLIFLFLLSGFLVPFLSWRFVFYLSITDTWFRLLYSTVPQVLYPSVLVISLVPLLAFLSYFLKRTGKTVSLQWNLTNILSGGVFAGILIFLLFKVSYDPRNERFLETDYYVQQSEWDKVLKSSAAYPGNNRLVMHFTNLALYKTGRLADEMFHYRQAGTRGLWLDWARNETAPYYGGEIYYHLASTNEAFRWAFEAMEAKGPNPRCLKRLVLTCLINKEYAIAGKYLSLLNETLHYRSWAQHYLQFVRNPGLAERDPEIGSKRFYIVTNDFIADVSPVDIGLYNLLDNHPDNRMAFEYMMAAFLLNKNLKGIADNIYRLRELGYNRIPVHYEEALILYMGISRQNVLPGGYYISSGTQERFHRYAEIFAIYRDNPFRAHQALAKEFGSTFWFYMQFENENPGNDEEK